MPSSIAAFELAKLGAEVVKVEFFPNGDYLRVNPPHIGTRGDMHLDLNRNKRSICIDPGSDGWAEVLRDLIARADAVVVAARPQSLEKLGLDYSSCLDANPEIIYCALSGYGHDGPYSRLAAHGLSPDLAAGLVPIERDNGVSLVARSYLEVGTRAAGANAALAVVGALYGRDVRQQGPAYIDVSQWDSAVAWNYRDLDQFANTGERIPDFQDLGYRYSIYRTSDDREVLLAAPEPAIWQKFCSFIGRDDLVGDETGEVIEFREDLSAGNELRQIFRTRTQAEWVELGASSGVPIGPVVELEDLPTDPHLEHREMLISMDHPLGGRIRLAGHAPKVRGRKVTWTPAPELGEHSSEVLRDLLNYSDDQIAELIETGAIRPAPRADEKATVADDTWSTPKP
jgi:crotonobetainyl-CoA:carnitine CoA-transferase CaiB-like acyl-CoA transferase